VREFENALILKRILFESFDCYAILFYIAFYQLKCQRLQTEVLALYTTGPHLLYCYKSACFTGANVRILTSEELLQTSCGACS
jgi:hypothetical protein